MARSKSSKPPTTGQISLFNLREVPDSFRKAVQVVHSKPKSPLSLLQRKLGNAWLKHAIESQADANGWWEIGIQNLAESIGFDSNNRQYLKESAEALMRVIHEWDVLATDAKRVQWKASVLFPEVEIRSDVIRYQVSGQMRDRLIHPEMYALIDMNVVRRFRRAPSLAIWEFCVRFEKLGRTAEVPWETFRDMILGESAESKTYKEYKFFKAKVLNPAIAEINSESHHTIALVESKIGRRIHALRFDVGRKKVIEQGLEDDDAIRVVSELGKLGVPSSEGKRLAASHGTAEISAAIDYTRRRLADKKQAPLVNPGAYFRRALSQGFAVVDGPGAVSDAKSKRAEAFDLRGAFNAKRIDEAESYFGELDPSDQARLMEGYNSQQGSASLKLNKRATRAARTAFFGWLAITTWGEPSQEELLEFAQGLIASK